MIKNCTKQTIRIISKGGEVDLPPAGIIPWIKIKKEKVWTVQVEPGIEVPVYRELVEEVSNIPEREEGVMYIVSMKVSDAFPERDDFLVPVVMKDHGNIYGTTSFRQRYRGL